MTGAATDDRRISRMTLCVTLALVAVAPRMSAERARREPTVMLGRAAAEGVFARGFALYGPSADSPKPPLPPPLIPSHLRVQALGDVAIITFEVVWPTELARRTLVAHREGGEWRIVHIHESSADTPR
ncbi:hypothetical protein BH11GEM2_BH11GEM2_08340 [soil metagenome]